MINSVWDREIIEVIIERVYRQYQIFWEDTVLEKNKEIKLNRKQVALALVRIMWRKEEINDSWYSNILRNNGVSEKDGDVDETEE